MLPRLVPEILILDAFCDGAAGAGTAAAAGAGIGDSRSWMICPRPFKQFMQFMQLLTGLHTYS